MVCQGHTVRVGPAVVPRFASAKHDKVRTRAADHQAALVFLPTRGSWLNRIEGEFAALRPLALNSLGELPAHCPRQYSNGA